MQGQDQGAPEHGLPGKDWRAKGKLEGARFFASLCASRATGWQGEGHSQACVHARRRTARWAPPSGRRALPSRGSQGA
eukprot:1945744-Pyramimonas_sp.AAC.1